MTLASLFGCHFGIEVLEGKGKWLPHEGEVAARCFGKPATAARGLTIAKDCAYVDGQMLQNVKWHSSSHGITFGGGGYDGPMGQLAIDRHHTSFVGTMSASTTSEIKAVRGYNTAVHYKTWRKAVDGTCEDWDDLLIATEFVDGVLERVFKLGTTDVSDRTSVTAVEEWETTYEMVEGVGMEPEHDSFMIATTLDFSDFTSHFTGWYQDDTSPEGTEKWDWEGTSYTPENQKATRDAHIALLQKKAPPAVPKKKSATLTVQDLNSIASLDPNGKLESGEIVFKDRAQEKAGEHIQNMLLYSLQGGNSSGEWIDQLFRGRPSLKESLVNIQKRHKEWFEKEAIPNMGQILHDNVSDLEYKEILEKIAEDVIEKNYEAFGESEDYARASQEVYLVAYREVVDEIRPYLDDPDTDWGEAYFNFLTSENFLNNWAIQVASDQYDNVKQTMYEQNVKLTLLCEEDSDVPREVLSIMMSTILGVNISNVIWNDEMRPFVEKSVRELLEGTIDFPTEVGESIDDYKQIAQETLESLTSMDQLVQFFAEIVTRSHHGEALKKWSPAWMSEAAEDIAKDKPTGTLKTVKKWGSKFGECMKTIGFGALGGFLLYNVFAGESDNIIQDISLTIIGGVFLLESASRLIPKKLGKWVSKKITALDDSLQASLKKFTKWFGKEGVDPDSTIAKILGKNKSAFFAKRLGPALAVFGIALAAMALKFAIGAGDIANTVFESINLIIEIAGLVFIGLELAGFAWAGPAGLFIAIAGLVVTLFQVIWNIFRPPTPPPDPIKEYVNGPLKVAGFTRESAPVSKSKYI